MEEVLFDTDSAKLSYYKSDRILVLSWKKQITVESYREVFTKGIEFLKTNPATGFASDIRLEGAVSIENLRWLAREVIPRANQLGLKKIAMVLKDELFSKIYADILKKRIEDNQMKIQEFDNMEAAKAWLLSD